MTTIKSQQQTIAQALAWQSHVPQSEQAAYRKKLINARRELKKIEYALSEACSTAAFGESQMGKSYLVSALLSTPSTPFSVTDGQKNYNFISEINPSSPNSQVEATGVITRFTLRRDEQCPEGHLRVQLLTVADVVLLLCEAYYNQVLQDGCDSLSAATIDERIEQIVAQLGNTATSTPLLDEDEVLDIQEYLKSPSIQQKCSRLHDSRLFETLLTHIQRFSEAQQIEALTLLWDCDANISRLFADLLATYRALGYERTVYASFNGVLKSKGSLLDVARLDEMYNTQPENAPKDYTPTVHVTLQGGKEIEVKKSFFSALIAELDFVLPQELATTHEFLKKLDILDFPGARRPEQIAQSRLVEGKNLSIVLRRGKVTYLFNKYSTAKRISTLLFCHNNSQSAESTMGLVLDAWIKQNVGATEAERETFTQRAGLPPLFIIGTWFNKDLEFNDERSDDQDALVSRWNRRFTTVLEKEVLKSLDDNAHWFNKWSRTQAAFQNLYMLRDFKYSKAIYHGYNPELGTPEQGKPVQPVTYPDYFERLRESFVRHEFVQKHFADPARSWDVAATCAHDGTQAIIDGLNRISSQMVDARNEKFANDLRNVSQQVRGLLESYYHSDNTDEQVKKAKRQAGAACIQLDRLIGRDSYAFGRLMDSLSVGEAELYELVHSQLLGEEQALPMTDEETSIFMSAGMDSSLSREDNLQRLCDYLGVDSEEECAEQLEGIDIDNLLSQSRMQADRAETLLTTVETLWHEKVLTERAARSFEDDFPALSNITSALWTLYGMLGVHGKLVNILRSYLETIDQEIVVGIIADYLTMEFNRFTTSFGQDFMTADEKNRMERKGQELKALGGDVLLSPEETPKGLELLTLLAQQKRVLSGNSFGQKDRKLLSAFPQFGSVWRWQRSLRLGFLQACDVPDYDLAANAALGKILETA